MKNKILSALLLGVMIMPNVTALAEGVKPNTTTYYNYRNVDLQGLDIRLDNDGELSYNIKSNSRNLETVKHKNTLDEALESNIEVEKNLKENLKNNKELVGISYTECYVLESVDENGEIKSKLMTVDEVNEFKKDEKAAVNPGVSESRGKLTLVSNLIADANLVGRPNTYSLSASAVWDVSGNNSNGENSPAVGDDFIGLCWPSSYQSNGTYAAKGFYNNGGEIQMYKSSFGGDRGIIWAFKDKIESSHLFIGSRNLSAAAQIVPQNSSSSLKSFTAEYVHTYEQKKASASLNASTTGVAGGITVSNVEKQWTIVSPVTVTIR